MQLQRQSIRVMEEGHLLAGIIINTNRLTFNSHLCQFFHCLLHTLHAKGKVTQTTCLRAVHTLRVIERAVEAQPCEMQKMSDGKETMVDEQQ